VGQSSLELCWFISGVVVVILHDAWHSPGLYNVSQAGLEPVAATVVAMAALKFSQCNLLLGSFPQARGAGC
jgi:hypothetical protein